MENSTYKIPEVVSGGVVNSKAINLVQPKYSPEAKKTGFSGQVYVKVMIDEEGAVTSASYISGNPLLKTEAEAAARQSKFFQTNLLGKNVKVMGVIIYSFNNK